MRPMTSTRRISEADTAVPLTPGHLARKPHRAQTPLTSRRLRLTAADALHPGYGFLSENPALADACGEAGLVWVGPAGCHHAGHGGLEHAKETVAAAGVPVLPSVVLRQGMSDDEVLSGATSVGFPVLVKASAGSSGRGMRLVEAPGDLGGAVAAARREAAAAFGSDEVFLERYLRSPRHVEVQVVGDEVGTILHLFDRECSVQRRHQKVIEVAPAILVDTATRGAAWQAATLAASGGRVSGRRDGGGFLVDGLKIFFFLEMNTRLQVEHGVTELVTGLDLVGLQFTVAAGRPLPISQAQVTSSGHAIEVRVCAERPSEDYRPTPGEAGHVRWPHGPGIRVGATHQVRRQVGPACDSLVAKVMAWADDRASARARLGRAVDSLELDGLETNRSLLAAVLADDAFVKGDIGVDYLDARPDLRVARLSDETRYRHAAAAALALLQARSAQSLVPVPAAGWRNVGAALHIDEFTDSVGTLEVRAPSLDGPVSLRRQGEWLEIGCARVSDERVDLTSLGIRRRYAVRVSPHAAEVSGPEGQSSFARRGEDDPDDQSGLAGECRAPLPGAIAKILVTEGDAVVEGDALVVLEAMKMEHTLRAAGAGTVGGVFCTVGQQVDVGDLLVVVTPE